MTIAERDKMFSQWYPLVWYCVRKLHCGEKRGMPLAADDAAQVGSIGLLKAIKHYNPSHASRASFKTFAQRVITQHIVDECSNTRHTIRVPRFASFGLYRYTQGLSVKKPVTQECLAFAERSTNTERISSRRTDWFESESVTLPAPDYFGDENVGPTLGRALKNLPFWDRRLVHERFGLNGEKPASCSVLASRYGTTRQNISYRLKEICKRLRKALEKYTAEEVY